MISPVQPTIGISLQINSVCEVMVFRPSLAAVVASEYVSLGMGHLAYTCIVSAIYALWSFSIFYVAFRRFYYREFLVIFHAIKQQRVT